MPRISNSDLSELRNDVFGYTPRPTVAAFAFGTALHELVLEPRKLPDLPDCIDLDLVYDLAHRVRNDQFCKWALQFSRKELVQLWADPATGLPLKSKLDLVHRDRLIVDLKSTGQKDYAGFLRSLTQYDYDRQAAFYLDSLATGDKSRSRPRFTFVGVQKCKPYNIWVVQPSTSFLEGGRKKYRALLREWKRRELAGRPFTPSSWAIPAPETRPDLMLA